MHKIETLEKALENKVKCKKRLNPRVGVFEVTLQDFEEQMSPTLVSRALELSGKDTWNSGLFGGGGRKCPRGLLGIDHYLVNRWL